MPPLYWSLYYVSHQLHLQHVQRRFFKFLSFRLDGIYPSRGTDYVSFLVRHGVDAFSSRIDVHGACFMGTLVRATLDNLIISIIIHTYDLHNF